MSIIALTKAKPAKAGDAKPRVLASSATLDRHEGPQDRRAAEEVIKAAIVFFEFLAAKEVDHASSSRAFGSS